MKEERMEILLKLPIFAVIIFYVAAFFTFLSNISLFSPRTGIAGGLVTLGFWASYAVFLYIYRARKKVLAVSLVLSFFSVLAVVFMWVSQAVPGFNLSGVPVLPFINFFILAPLVGLAFFFQDALGMTIGITVVVFLFLTFKLYLLCRVKKERKNRLKKPENGSSTNS